MKDSGVVLIGIPGLKDEYTGHARELLSDWFGDDAYMFQKSRGKIKQTRDVLMTSVLSLIWQKSEWDVSF